MKQYLPFFFIVLLLSCSENKSKDSNSVVVQDSIVTDKENTEAVRLVIPGLFEYFASQDKSFSASNFVNNGSASLNNLNAYPVEERLKQFYPYLIYNSDSSLAIDLYSYNYMVQEKEGEKNFQAAEPDSEIALINFKNNSRKRLIYTGPGISFLDAKWIDAKELLIAGAEEINNNQIQPLLWEINLSDSTMQIYKYSDTLNAKVYPYTDRKLKPTSSFKSI